MKQQHVSTIEGELRHADIAKDDTSRRHRIASAIATTHQYFGQDQVARLRAGLAKEYVGLALDEALEELLLSGKWVDLDREMRASEAVPSGKSVSSHLQHVTDHNPYGWQNPELQRCTDHDIPGAWNAFRQSYNLTAAEKIKSKARDHRVRGCTRWEVLGNESHPTAQFDADQVKAASARLEAERANYKVYGELP